LSPDTDELNAQATRPRRIRLPNGIRGAIVVAVIALLATVAGAAVVLQVTDQMRRDDETRLDRHAAAESDALRDLIAAASRDIRLARRNEIFEAALANTSGQLLPADRRAVEEAITYLGDRYQVDEICVIRASGLEAARWVGGAGVAPVSDLSPDERGNNPAVIPTLPMDDDSFFQSEPYVSPDSGRWVVGLATPIILNDGTHAGILHFEIPIQRFASVMGDLSFGGNSYTFMMDKTGRLLVHSQLAAFQAKQSIPADLDAGAFPLAAASGSPSWREAVGTMLAGDAGATTFSEDGKEFRLSYRAVPGSDRIVATVVPATELYADVDRALLNLAVTTGPLLLLILGVSAWFARRVSRANRRLAQVNESLASANASLESTSRSSTELARESAVVNQFTELTALSEDDIALSEATLTTLEELVQPHDAAVHVSNQSKDRAVPQASLGEHVAEVLSLHDLARCPALRRSSLYVTSDVTARLAFRCPVYPVEQGTLVCVPLVALGETVGAVHLHWATPRELPLTLRLVITRVAEHAALSIANRRLVLALRGQANTDARTGLTNTRSFDETAERILANRSGRDRVAILMLDLDHFKEFNDRFGHPAGDEALRAFANLLSSSIRDEDVAARYGGEEFAVCLPGINAAAAMEIAERIRQRTEATIIPLSPGMTGRITVSIGIATAPDDGAELLSLLKAADEALYRAKLDGRNRVVTRELGVSRNGTGNGTGNGKAAGLPASATRRKGARKPPSEPRSLSA
jgi:diguanylate cyclase (GGDEF)-like protein